MRLFLTIVLRMLNGDRQTVEVQETDTVMALKRKIRDDFPELGFHLSDMRLMRETVEGYAYCASYLAKHVRISLGKMEHSLM